MKIRIKKTLMETWVIGFYEGEEFDLAEDLIEKWIAAISSYRKIQDEMWIVINSAVEIRKKEAAKFRQEQKDKEQASTKK